MRQNPRMKILSVNGYYDLATPFHGAEYEFRHMALEPQIAANIRYTYYPAGHMMYIDPASARGSSRPISPHSTRAPCSQGKGPAESNSAGPSAP